MPNPELPNVQGCNRANMAGGGILSVLGSCRLFSRHKEKCLQVTRQFLQWVSTRSHRHALQHVCNSACLRWAGMHSSGLSIKSLPITHPNSTKAYELSRLHDLICRKTNLIHLIWTRSLLFQETELRISGHRNWIFVILSGNTKDSLLASLTCFSKLYFWAM